MFLIKNTFFGHPYFCTKMNKTHNIYRFNYLYIYIVFFFVMWCVKKQQNCCLRLTLYSFFPESTHRARCPFQNFVKLQLLQDVVEFCIGDLSSGLERSGNFRSYTRGREQFVNSLEVCVFSGFLASGRQHMTMENIRHI